MTSLAQLAAAVEYTDCISAEDNDFPSTSVLYMTINHRMARLQPGRFGEWRVPLHCHCSQVHSDPEC